MVHICQYISFVYFLNLGYYFVKTVLTVKDVIQWLLFQIRLKLVIRLNLVSILYTIDNHRTVYTHYITIKNK